jgi:hypothetical protein
MLAAPREALTLERPVTVPLPESCEKVMTLKLSAVSTLLLVSSIVAVAVQVVSETMFDEHPPSTTWLATPGPVGEKLLLGNEVTDPDLAVKV